jgi:hypothetical protein
MNLCSLLELTFLFKYGRTPHLKFVWETSFNTSYWEKSQMGIVSNLNRKLLLHWQTHYTHSEFKPNNVFLRYIYFFLLILWDMKEQEVEKQNSATVLMTNHSWQSIVHCCYSSQSVLTLLHLHCTLSCHYIHKPQICEDEPYTEAPKWCRDRIFMSKMRWKPHMEIP